jgi:hypothetical protein
MKQNKNQTEIADKIGVTHQAISIAYIHLVDKIKQKIKFGYNTESPEKIEIGLTALDSLLNDHPLPLTGKDRKDLLSFASKNYKVYTLEELEQSFKNGRFNSRQISGVLNLNNLGSFIKKKIENKSNYTQEEVDLIIKMNNEGKFIEDIAEALQKNIRNISCKCASMIKNQLIKRCPQRKPQKPKYNKKDSKKMLEMFKEGVETKEIAKYFKVDTRSIGIQRGRFCRKGLIGLSKKSKKNKKCLLQKS